MRLRSVLNSAKVVALSVLALQGTSRSFHGVSAQPHTLVPLPGVDALVGKDSQGELMRDSYGNVPAFDKATGAPMVDSITGMPKIVDPHSGAITLFRRQPQPNPLPQEMVRGALAGANAEHADPEQIRQELFDEYGILDPDKLERAMRRFAPEDIYMSMVASSKFTRWDGQGLQWSLTSEYGQQLLAQLDLEWSNIRVPDSREAATMLAALLAFTRQNAPYTGTKNGDVPLALVTDRPPKGGDAVSSVDWRLAFVPSPSKGGEVERATQAFHEYCHLHQHPDWELMLADTVTSIIAPQLADLVYTRLLEGATEFIATLWTRNSTDANYEHDERMNWRTHKLSLALVSALSRDTGTVEDNKIVDADLERGRKDTVSDDLLPGIDVLCRAYFTGDVSALRKTRVAIASLLRTQAFRTPTAYYMEPGPATRQGREEL